MNDPHRFHELSKAFERLRQVPCRERDSTAKALETEFDRALVREALALLVHHDSEEAALGTGNFPVPDAGRYDETSSISRLPESIGGYRILELIGAGGMGLVYRAEQPQPQRQVALKIIRPGLFSAEMKRRFEFESTALGQLQHPGIAQVFDAGVAEEHGGRPYFVMEYVDGLPLLDYCQQFALRTEFRLRLFTEVCDAVTHAHQRGIIHRDIKPSNIMVAREGQPKILDFGVARAVDADIKAATVVTAPGQLIGTLRYMSPEQVQGKADLVDTRSDVYALGVLLYELLVGQLPIDVGGAYLTEAAKAICENAPTPLSHHGAQYRGDLNTIVLRALEKDPARRYPSALAFGNDVRRFLASEPIHARPASLSYQLKKFAGRHKALVAASVMTFVALVAGIVGTASQAYRVTRQRNIAEQETAVALSINQFIAEWLGSVDPMVREGNKSDITMREALAFASRRLEQDPPGQIRVARSLHGTIGNAYLGLGLLDEAEPHIQKALDQARGATDEVPGDSVAGALYGMSTLRRFQGKYIEAKQLLEEAIGLYESLGEEAKVASCFSSLSLVMMELGKYDKAVEHAEQSKRILDAQGQGEGSKKEWMLQVTAMHSLGAALLKAGRYEEALELVKIANERTQQFDLGEGTLSYGLGIEALISGELGDHDAAIRCGRRVIELTDKLFGVDHPNRGITRANLCVMIKSRDVNDPEAETLIRDAVEILNCSLGSDHPNTITARAELAHLLNSTGRHEEAHPILLEVFEFRRENLGDEHSETLAALTNLITYHRHMSEYGEGAKLVAPFLELFRERYGDDHERVFYLEHVYARNRHDQGYVEKNEDAIEESIVLYERIHERYFKEKPETAADIRKHWARALKHLGRDEESRALLEKYSEQ